MQGGTEHEIGFQSRALNDTLIMLFQCKKVQSWMGVGWQVTLAGSQAACRIIEVHESNMLR